MAGIEILNHDVLREIFSYLDIYDRVRMGLVCKKWHNVVEIMMGSIHKMCIHVVDIRDHRSYSKKIQNDVLKIRTSNGRYLEKPLRKFASNLYKIKIEDNGRWDTSPYIYKLLKKCTNLTYARLVCQRSQSVEHFLEFLPTDNLEDLSIILNLKRKMEQWPRNSYMDKVLANSPKLKSLELHNVPITELSSIGGMETLKALYINVEELPHLSFDMKKLRNLETLVITCMQLGSRDNLINLIRNCKKLHSVRFGSDDPSYEIILNEMISLPNLRRLCLLDFYESWHNFSNLEEIQIWYDEPSSMTKDQIKSFLERSENLKTYYFFDSEFEELFQNVVIEIGHECERKDIKECKHWYYAIPF
ncbi:hypothetical protein PV325_006267 [Microctonus aethiopoides]|nr:hypothetical protein PV325_006267 [Microctonus aethiopoides]